MTFLILLSALLAMPQANSFCDLSSEYLENIHLLRITGELDKTRNAAHSALECFLPDEERFALLIELSSIEDRIGLHQNTRPVAAALEAINAAGALSENLLLVTKATLMLARAEYSYRAEMAGRKFEEAEKQAYEALGMFETLESNTAIRTDRTSRKRWSSSEIRNGVGSN